MRHGRYVIALLTLCISSSLFAQSNGQTGQWSPAAQQQAAWNAQQQNSKAWQDSIDRDNRRMIQDLPKIREHLAETWQKFGLKPDAAKAIASTYVIQRKASAPTSIKGKTDGEVATMMQQALTSKQYLLANQLLIQYERRRLHLPESSN
jgi:hypothetical protein